MPQPHELTPESMMLRQLDGHWQKLFGALLFKLSGTDAVHLTTADFVAFQNAFPGSMPIIKTHGHVESIEVQVISREEAEKLAAAEEARDRARGVN